MGADLALGGLSLAIQLLSNCYSAYSLAETWNGMPDDVRALNARLEIEHNRLKSFASAAEINTNDQSLPRTIQLHAPSLVPILAEIETILAEIIGKTGTVSSPAYPSHAPNGVRIQLSQSAPSHNTDTGAKARVVWSLRDKEHLTKAVIRLSQLNDSLYELLDRHQLHTLRDELKQTYLELVQVKQTVKDLETLADAANQARLSASASSPWQQVQNAALGDLALFKAYASSLLERALSSRADLLISPDRISLQDEPDVEHVLQVAQYIHASGLTQEVWLIWHYQKAVNAASDPAQLTPIEELTALLKAPRPGEFGVPTCLGYCNLPKPSTRELRTAIVFERPQNLSNDVRPINLLDAFQQTQPPSLTKRLTLARSISKCLLYLHSVNWLHKAFRSEAIIVGESAQRDLDLDNPYLTGFDFSRRARWNESSGPKPRFGRIEAYLHPDAQFNRPPQYYRKTFDIYSLGIVLIEIACWKSILEIMGIEQTAIRSPLATSTIRARLLTDEPYLLAEVGNRAGDKYVAAVKTCLEGRDAYGITHTDEETSAATSLKIQQGFHAHVIRVLDDIVL